MNSSNNIKYYKIYDIYLAVAHIFNFDSLEYWDSNEVGDSIIEHLLARPEKYIGIYIYHTEDGDNINYVAEVLECMNEDENDLMMTFTQCFTCHKIGCIGQSETNLNEIIMFGDSCTPYCNECQTEKGHTVIG